jgi:hypothetical protein
LTPWRQLADLCSGPRVLECGRRRDWRCADVPIRRRA